MPAPMRFDVRGACAMDPSGPGDFVKFADVEQALADSEMLDWLMPIICGNDTTDADGKTERLVRGLSQHGLTGRELVRWAMEHP